METWTTVIVAFIVAASTLGATFLQNRHSNKLFEKQHEKAKEELEKQLEKAKEEQKRQRRWEVRSEPLLKLRDGLAQMAARLDRLVINTEFPRNLLDTTEEAENKRAQWAVEELRDYMTSKDFLPIRHLQYDTELVKLMDDIEDNYVLLFAFTLDLKNLKSEGRQELTKISQKIKKKIPGVQELINKRLEEL